MNTFVKKYVLCGLLMGFTSTAVWAQSADTASTAGARPQEGTVVAGPRFPQSATDALVELDLSSSEIIELDADEEDGGSQSVSGLLGASRDVFVSQVQYNLSPFRFNPRGYESDYSSVYFNGFSFNDAETGYANYNVWGGLNDVLRNYTTAYGLAPSESSFGNFAGTTTYSTRASVYRKQTSVSIGASNRTYATRLMATYSSGLLNNGWAFTASASARLAKEGFMDGTPYEGYSYFISVEKQLNKKHALNLTIFGAPIQRGMSSAVIQDVYDLTDSYRYNPNWGYQDGEKRSARIRNTHMPVAMLNYFWAINEKSKFEAGVAVQTGRNGTSALDWFEGNDPRPDYYRKLPRWNSSDATQTTNSYANPSIYNLYTQEWQSGNSKVTQIDWNALYGANYAANYGVNRADSGWQAMTILKEYRNDQTTVSGYVNYRNYVNRYVSVFGGLEGKAYKGSFFQTVLDPLGADYYLNVDKYILGTAGVAPELSLYNENENGSQLRKYKGDRFGYDYDIYQNNIRGWAEAQIKLDKFDFFVAGTLDYTEFWRDSHMRNARVESIVAGHSYGVSDKKTFVTYGVKANATYKITGKHFVTANVGTQTRPPLFRNSYIQSRYADLTLDDYKAKGMQLETEKIYTGDIAYIFRGPSLRLKAAVFATLAQDLSEVRTFYDENTVNLTASRDGALIEYITQGMDKQYTGIELGASYKITSTITAEAAFTHGAYIHASDPNVTKVEDSQVNVGTVQKAQVTGYALGGVPQTAGTMTFTYRSPKYWFVGITGNLVGNTYVDMYLDRRTQGMIDRTKISGSDTYDLNLYHKLVDQEKYPWAYTLDVFGGASWRVNGGILGFNGNLQNVTNNFFKTGGYEQTRVPLNTAGKPVVDVFPSKYYYSFGFNFFVQVYYRF